MLPLHRVARRRAVLPLLCVACRHASAARRLRGPIPRERGFTRGRSLVFASASCAQITRDPVFVDSPRYPTRTRPTSFTSSSISNHKLFSSSCPTLKMEFLKDPQSQDVVQPNEKMVLPHLGLKDD